MHGSNTNGYSHATIDEDHMTSSMDVNMSASVNEMIGNISGEHVGPAAHKKKRNKKYKAGAGATINGRPLASPPSPLMHEESDCQIFDTPEATLQPCTETSKITLKQKAEVARIKQQNLLASTTTANATAIASRDYQLPVTAEIPDDINKRAFAEDKKTMGNHLYGIKKYQEAVKCYTEAINATPGQCSPYLSNRAAALMMLNRYKEALQDVNEAVIMDDSFTKAYIRKAKILLVMGEFAECREICKKMNGRNPADITELPSVLRDVTTVENLCKQMDKSEKDPRFTLHLIDKVLELCKLSAVHNLKKVMILVQLARYNEAKLITEDFLQFNNIDSSLSTEMIYYRGLCLYYLEQLDKAMEHFRQLLNLAPDHANAQRAYKKAKLLQTRKSEGNELVQTAKYAAALEVYTEALNIDEKMLTFNAKLYSNRAHCHMKLSNYDAAIEDCTKAINNDGMFVKAILRRAACYTIKEEYEKSLHDYKKVKQLEPSAEHNRLLEEAKRALKMSKRLDYYKVLGVSKTADLDEIKKAYKRHALLHHPDRHSHAEEEVKKEEERKFKELGEAYAILSDATKRNRYDNGADIEELNNDSGGGFHSNNFNDLFASVFRDSRGGGFPGGGGFTFKFG